MIFLMMITKTPYYQKKLDVVAAPGKLKETPPIPSAILAPTTFT